MSRRFLGLAVPSAGLPPLQSAFALLHPHHNLSLGGELDGVADEFISTCRNRRGSPTTCSGRSAGRSQTNFSPFSRARTARILTTCWTACGRLNGTCSNSNRPASMREKSRISLRSSSSRSADSLAVWR